MKVVTQDAPRLMHAIPGRVRIHLPACPDHWCQNLDTSLSQLIGVQTARVNALTANIVIRFDPALTNDQVVLHAVIEIYTARGADARAPTNLPAERPAQQNVKRNPVARPERRARTVRARIPVRGMDRSPHVARHVAEHLATKHPGVRAKVSMLTSRVFVEFEEHEDDLDDLCAELSGMDLPDTLEADDATDPLDPGPLIQSATRTAGAALGLSLISGRRLAGGEHPFDPAGPIQVSAVMGVLSGVPPVRKGLRRLFGRDIADVLLSVPAIVALVLSDSPLGLLLGVAEGLRLFTEVVSRRASWRRFEARLLESPTPAPGTFVRVENGERAPLSATVVEGFGTATAHDGLPARVAPGEQVSAGARLYGGPFVLDLDTPEPFTPVPRPAPLGPTLYSRYTRLAMPASLAYAALLGVMSRSFTGALEGMLLVSPRTAVIGMEAAEIGAAARVLRAGVTNVGTRRHRMIHFPHVLLLDGPRLLTDGLEVAQVLPLDDTWNATGLLESAAAISAAAGSPWGAAFRAPTRAKTAEGTFDGESATANIAGKLFSMSPITNNSAEDQAVTRMRNQGHYVLQIRGERARRPLGYLALRPRLAPGARRLIETCHRHDVTVALVTEKASATAQAIAQLMAIPVYSETDPSAAIRRMQAQGRYVALLSDHAQAAAAFDAADLAIGVADEGAHLPARADLIAPDLSAVSAVIEAGVRAELGERGSVALSLVANVVGAVWGLSGQVGIELASEAIYLSSLAAVIWDWIALLGGANRRLALGGADVHP